MKVSTFERLIRCKFCRAEALDVEPHGKEWFRISEQKCHIAFSAKREGKAFRVFFQTNKVK